MHCIKKVTEDIFWIGVSDRRLALFENVFPVPNGVSYNSYVINDQKTALLDTADKAVSGQFLENLKQALSGKPLDYIIVNHMEPDHCAVIEDVILRYPGVKVVGNKKTRDMLSRFFGDLDVDGCFIEVKENDSLSLGKHTLNFVMAPMVHWPEAMVTYESTEKILFSADAFGSFGALSGNLFADEINFENEWLSEARRYYTNIVGKYGTQVIALLKKAATLDISIICPLHGPLFRKNIAWIVDKYVKWATYTPEQKTVMIAYASVYGNTENAANILAVKLAEKGIRNISMYDVSVTHPSYIVSEAFRCSHLVFASTTYNAGIFVNMETALVDIAAHNLQNRTVAFIENGSWAATAGNLMREIIAPLKGTKILETEISIPSSVKTQQMQQLEALSEEIAKSIFEDEQSKASESEKKIVDGSAMFKMSYGLFVLTAKDGGKENGCIINTAMQVCDSPKRISIAVNKSNLTHDMIENSGMFNLSVLSTDATFDIFKHFGFSSGRDTEKFKDYENSKVSQNGLRYIENQTNAFFSVLVNEKQDCGTHTIFTGDVTEAVVLSEQDSMTYEYYFAHVKPKPPVSDQNKVGYVCKICGWVYEGEPLPEDIICPLCKHGASDFEKL